MIWGPFLVFFFSNNLEIQDIIIACVLLLYLWILIPEEVKVKNQQKEMVFNHCQGSKISKYMFQSS